MSIKEIINKPTAEYKRNILAGTISSLVWTIAAPKNKINNSISVIYCLVKNYQLEIRL